jgi:hypothetical protein
MVMLALNRLGDEAYGVPISLEIEEQSGRDVAKQRFTSTVNRLIRS